MPGVPGGVSAPSTLELSGDQCPNCGGCRGGTMGCDCGGVKMGTECSPSRWGNSTPNFWHKSMKKIWIKAKREPSSTVNTASLRSIPLPFKGDCMDKSTCSQSHDNILRLVRQPIFTLTPSGNSVRSKICLSLVPVTLYKPGSTVDIDPMHPQKLLARNPPIQVFCPSLACLPDNTI